MNFKTININIENKIASVEINRPDVLNAFNSELILELQQVTKMVKDDDNVRVVILTGAGRAFSSGADLSEVDPKWDSTKDGLLNGYKPSFENIISMAKPVIASIQGPAAGIGAAFAMACDLRIMSEDAYILSVFSNIALVPDGGLSWLLPRYLGYGKAYEYAIEAKKIDARECLHFGIANKISSADKLKEAYDAIKETALEVENDESDKTAVTEMCEMMKENAALAAMAAKELSENLTADVTEEGEDGEGSEEVNENPAVAMAAAQMMKEI